MTEDVAVRSLREYLTIKTAVPEPDYDGAVKFLSKLAQDIGLEFCVINVERNLPVVILTLPGTNPNFPSIMLYSHTDVVPAFPEFWKYSPYSGHKDEQGNIYGRGAQDMKSVGIQYVEAVRRLKNQGKCQFLRTIYIVFGPDEEIGGMGMKGLIASEKFSEMNVGFVMDEGIASEDDVYRLHFAEREIWWLKVTCVGNPGHASKFVQNTAAQKLQKVINKMLVIREESEIRFNKDKELSLGDVITVNLTKIEIQSKKWKTKHSKLASLGWDTNFDMRIPPTENLEKLEEKIETILRECGPDVTLEYINEKDETQNLTSTGPDNPFWTAVTGVLDKLHLKHENAICFGATDSNYLRAAGYWSMGVNFMLNTTQLLHDHNEYINEDEFLNGLEIYTHIIPAIANL